MSASDSKSTGSEQLAAGLSSGAAGMAVTDLKVSTVAELATFNAIGGKPAYVAYKGIVYDLTTVSNWSSGKHQGISAGTDVTEVFASSPHATSILNLGIIVGTMEGFKGTVPARIAASQSGTSYLSDDDDDRDGDSDEDDDDDDDDDIGDDDDEHASFK